MEERKIHWVSVSRDKKTGPIAVSYSPIDTCPDSCSLKKGGCYAWGLFYLRILGAKINNGKIITKTLATALKERRNDCKVVRHRIAGDIVGDVKGTLKECEYIDKSGLTNIGYTHHWKADEAQPLKKWFRASCQNMKEVVEARSMGWSTVLMKKTMSEKSSIMTNGEKAIKCPARHDVEGKMDITCNSCTLCKVTKATADKTIVFETHGSPKTISMANDSLV